MVSLEMFAMPLYGKNIYWSRTFIHLKEKSVKGLTSIVTLQFVGNNVQISFDIVNNSVYNNYVFDLL